MRKKRVNLNKTKKLTLLFFIYIIIIFFFFKTNFTQNLNFRWEKSFFFEILSSF